MPFRVIIDSFDFNFSKPGFQMIHQYYNLLTYGREGYTKIYNTCLQNARFLSNFLKQREYFEVLSVVHKKVTQKEKNRLYTLKTNVKNDDEIYNEEYQPGLPVVAFRFSKNIREKYPEIPQSIFSMLLRNKGFIVPNYHLPPDENEKEILRVVVRKTLSMNLMENLCGAIIDGIELLVNSCEDVREVISDKAKTDDERHSLVFDLLLSIASGGDEEIKKIQKVSHEPKDKQSYRGAC